MAILNTARSIGDEPFLISQLVRISIVATALDAADHVLGMGEPSDQVLQRFQEFLRAEDDEPTLLYVLEGERASADDMFTKLESGVISYANLSGGGVAPGKKPSQVSPITRLIVRGQRATALEWLNEAVRIARRPLEDQFADWEAWRSEIAEARKTFKPGLLAAWSANRVGLAVLLTPAIAVGQENDVWKHLMLKTTIALVAAERSRQKAGRWPTKLQEIDKSILPKVPIDPFTGKPILLLHREGKLYCYSVSFNRQDDHAKFAPKRRRDGPFDYGTSAWDPELRRRQAEPKKPAE